MDGLGNGLGLGHVQGRRARRLIGADGEDYSSTPGPLLILESERGNGRDDYPVRAIWNSILAGVVYQHLSVEALRRDLARNGELRKLCGFDPARGVFAVPPPSAYTHFLNSLLAHETASRSSGIAACSFLSREAPMPGSVPMPDERPSSA